MHTFIVFLTCLSIASSTQVGGSLRFDVDKQNFVTHLLARFGIGKGHSAYAYGTVKRDTDYIGFHSTITLALVPQKVWDAFYHMSSQIKSCHELVTQTLNESIMIRDDHCRGNGTKDYLRTLPCSMDIHGDYKSCNQPKNVTVFSGTNFTYHISADDTEYYYLFFLLCTRNFSSSDDCFWGSTDEISISYDFHLTNDRPNETKPFTSEFPYDLQGILPLQLVFILFYIILVVVHFLLHSRLCVERRYRMHLLVKLFSVSMVLEFIYVFFELIHYSVYAADGKGALAMKYLAEICNQFSDWILILVVILVGKGWQVTTSTLRWSKVTVFIWGAYILFSAMYFLWMVIAERVFPLSLSLYHSYQSWVGGIYLSYRLFILVYLLYEMRQVYMIEIRPTALKLYIVLAGCYIVWFSYLPTITLFALLVNPVRRLIVMTTFYLIFDFLINLGMVILFCPRWANKYFQFNNHINLLSQSSSHMYRSLKAYGGSNTPSPV